MTGRLLRISMEPAPGYLPFVESHLTTLRHDAQRLTGDGSIAEEVSSGVLTDVALRWYWFELLRVGLHRADPAGAFLGVALTRRCARRLREPDEAELDVDVVVRVEPVTAARATDWSTVGWFPEPDITLMAHQPAAPAWSGPGSGPRPATSAAVRLAKVGAAPPPAAPSAVLEAVIAWLHAYETYTRYRRIAAAAVAVIVALVLFRLRDYGASF
jgi:hypothetical protein